MRVLLFYLTNDKLQYELVSLVQEWTYPVVLTVNLVLPLIGGRDSWDDLRSLS